MARPNDDPKNNRYHAVHWRILTKLVFGASRMPGAQRNPALVAALSSVSSLIKAIEQVTGRAFLEDPTGQIPTKNINGLAEQVWSRINSEE